MFKYDISIGHNIQKNNKIKIYNLLIINIILMILSLVIYYYMQIYYAFDRTFQCFNKAISKMRRASKMLSEIKKDTSHIKKLNHQSDILIKISQIKIFIIKNPVKFRDKINTMSKKNQKIVERFLLAVNLAP